MIKNVWYNKVLHKDRRNNGEWVKYSRKDFIKTLKINTERKKSDFFLPDEDFDISKYKEYIDYDKEYFFSQLLKASDYKLKTLYRMYPKQINQFKKLKDEGYFDQYKIENKDNQYVIKNENKDEKQYKVFESKYYYSPFKVILFTGTYDECVDFIRKNKELMLEMLPVDVE